LLIAKSTSLIMDEQAHGLIVTMDGRKALGDNPESFRIPPM
jgi:hypothetical protein